MMWTEERIRAALDGTLTRLAENGRVVTDKVKPDYIPTHKMSGGCTKGIPRGNYRMWTPEDTALLLKLRAQGETTIAISRVLARHPRSIRRRIEIVEQQS
jgi:hypothetical protein